MYDNVFLEDISGYKPVESNSSTGNNSIPDMDDLFDNLNSDIAGVSKFVTDLNLKKKANADELKKIAAAQLDLQRDKENYENYTKAKDAALLRKQQEIDEYATIQKNNLLKAENEFRSNMNKSLAEFELSKKEFENEKNKIKEEKEQFEAYKVIEMNRVRHAEEILASDKEQFEQYKRMTAEKFELESNNLKQKFAKIQEVINQFNMPVTENEE